MNRHIYRLVAAVLAAMTIVSCKDARKSETYRLLEDVDSYIEARPDSALATLQGIDKSELTSKELEAKYALLLSQALDKNYIDLQSDSIIAPAVRYYEIHGTPDERLKAFYYRGRISMNAENYDEAMEFFSIAGKYADNVNDKIAAGLLHNAKMRIYQHLYDSDSAISEAKRSSDMFLAGGDTTRYINAINGVLTGYLQIQDTTNAQYYLDIYKDFWPHLNTQQTSRYYSASLLLNIDKGLDSQTILKIIDEYSLNVKDESLIHWLIVAQAYCHLNFYNQAKEALDLYLEYGGKKERAYYILSSRISDGLGDTRRALDDLYQFHELDGNTDVELFTSDARFIEERYTKDIELLIAKHSKERIILISIIALLCTIIITYSIYRKLKIRTAEKKQLEIEKKRYEQLYADAIAECDALTKMIEDASVKDETKAVIRERLEVLNKVIISHITDTSSANKKAFQELAALVADRDSFIESTRLTIEGNNPGFITALREAGLTDEEINICCLYVIGLKGKDIKAYTSQPRHYIQSAEIRHKLGLTENDTNLSIHLREMLEK